MKSFPVVLVSSLTFLLVACSGSGGPRIRGEQCRKNHNPVPMQLSEEQNQKNKLSLKPGDDVDLTSGNYEFESAIFYWVGANDLRVEMRQFKPSGSSTLKTEVTCVRNAKMDLTGFNVEAPGISDIVVDSSGKPINAGVRQFRITFKDRRLEAGVEDLGDVETPSKLYEDEKATDYFLYKVNDNTYETRAEYQDDLGNTYYVLVRYKRKQAQTFQSPL